MQRNFSSYWRTNFWETTSGDFATDLLHFHVSQIGLDRITYSVDYPFITIESGEAWLKTLDLGETEKLALIRGTAIELLGLNK
jgi:2,3-dihydroxybenzoate decarboxylase